MARSAARMPRTSTPDALNGEDASACPSTIGAASMTPGTLEMRSATASQSVSGCSSGWISRCPLRPRILSSSSLRKPFITAITMISVATPSMMPRKENAGNDRDESLLAPRPQIAQRQHPFERSERAGAACLAHRIVPRPPDFTRFWPFQALPGRPRPARRTSSRRQPLDRIGGAHQFAAAVGALLDLDLALGKAFRPDQNLPGNADEVGGRELRSRALVEVVV